MGSMASIIRIPRPRRQKIKMGVSIKGVGMEEVVRHHLVLNWRARHERVFVSSTLGAERGSKVLTFESTMGKPVVRALWSVPFLCDECSLSPAPLVSFLHYNIFSSTFPPPHRALCATDDQACH